MDEQVEAAAAPTTQGGGLRRAMRWLFLSPAGLGVLALVFVGVLAGGTYLYHYSESTKFCTTCHTMIPQKKAHAASVHEEVTCAECHVAPGITGYVKAKIGGIRELMALVTNTYETPIRTPDRFDMPLTPVPGRAFTSSGAIPSAKDTCSECHDVSKISAPGEPTKMIVSQFFKSDATNSSQYVAIRIRPSAMGSNAVDNTDLMTADNPTGLEGVHWHVTQNVSIYNNEGSNGPIPLVEVTTAGGKKVQFIASSEVGLYATAGRDVQRLKGVTARRAMDCVDCHNRVGHEIKSVDSQLDAALAAGRISTSLPYIKRAAQGLISATYKTDAAADKAFAAWATDYAKANPTAPKGLVTAATAEIKRIYHLLDTPQMNATPTSYLNNLGHASGAGTGCFRCHDGMHLKVVNGVATDKVIPSTCSTCHSFPMVASTKVTLPTMTPPANHRDDLYIFNHSHEVVSVDAAFSGNGSCQTCHQKSTCTTCHESNLGKINHTAMLFNHAANVRAAGIPVCATCHQQEFCAQCHSNDINNQVRDAQASLKAYISDLS